MNAKQNEEVAVKFLTLFGSYDPKCLEMLDDDVKMHVGTERTGRCPVAGTKDKAAIWDAIESYKVIMPDGIEFNIKGVVGNETRVAVEAESHAKLLNGNKYTDIYENVYHFLFKIKENGQIWEITEFCDTYYASLLFAT